MMNQGSAVATMGPLGARWGPHVLRSSASEERGLTPSLEQRKVRPAPAARFRTTMPSNVEERSGLQARVVAALCDPARFGSSCQRVTLLETHISYVLLTGPFAC
jgi:hypothetical protein